MNNKELAEKIFKLVGGKQNIHSITHCATRLRIITHDKEKIDMKGVEDLDRVKGSFFNSGQYQIILGTGLVNKIYEEIAPMLGNSSTEIVETSDKSLKITFQKSIRIFGDIFVPIIPVLVAAGLFMGVRGLITQDMILGLVGLTAADIPQQFLLFTRFSSMVYVPYFWWNTYFGYCIRINAG